jgi:hypothetical protein
MPKVEKETSNINNSMHTLTTIYGVAFAMASN